MIYDLGKTVVATAILNRPEVNSSTKTNGDPCRYVFTGGRMQCLLLPLTAFFPSGLLLKWRSQNKFYFYWEGRQTHVHKTKTIPGLEALDVYHQTTSRLPSTENTAKAQERCACFIFCTPSHALCQWHLTHVSCICLSGSRAKLFGLPQGRKSLQAWVLSK